MQGQRFPASSTMFRPRRAATLFVEPMAAVKANNALRELLIREGRSGDRAHSGRSCPPSAAAHREGIDADSSETLVRLDGIFARARQAQLQAGRRARRSSARARRPELAPGAPSAASIPRQGRCPSIAASSATDYDTLVITGPNTGGKTVTLKTIGLLTPYGAVRPAHSRRGTAAAVSRL